MLFSFSFAKDKCLSNAIRSELRFVSQLMCWLLAPHAFVPIKSFYIQLIDTISPATTFAHFSLDYARLEIAFRMIFFVRVAVNENARKKTDVWIRNQQISIIANSHFALSPVKLVSTERGRKAN